MSPQLHPNGFRISDRPVAASFAHPYSFQPIADYSLRDEACFLSSSTLGGVEGVWVRYWDEGSTAAVLEFAVEEQVQSISATAAPKEKKEKKKKKDKGKGKEKVPEPSTSNAKDPKELHFNTNVLWMAVIKTYSD